MVEPSPHTKGCLQVREGTHLAAASDSIAYHQLSQARMKYALTLHPERHEMVMQQPVVARSCLNALHCGLCHYVSCSQVNRDLCAI